MRNLVRLFSLLCLLSGSLGWLASSAYAQDDEPEATEEAVPASVVDSDVNVAIEPTGDNGYCTICHNQPLRTVRLEDGTLLNLFVSAEMVTASVHGPTEDQPGLGCLDCHGEDAFPHSSPLPTDGRMYTLDQVSMCTSCHVDQADDLSMGLHAQAIEAGNLQAAVCTDCHGAHHIQSAEFQPQLVAGVCGDCHETALAEWQISPHADIGPLGCASCHNHHAQTLRVGETSTQLCTNCHNDMPEDVYAHETHLNGENAVACADCHMHTTDDDALLALDMETTGHTMLLDSTPCTSCHAELQASGEWAQITSTRADGTVVEEDESSEAIADAALDVETVPEESVAEFRNDSSYFIIQGLLVGLGLGLTFAIVFFTRANRNTASKDE